MRHNHRGLHDLTKESGTASRTRQRTLIAIASEFFTEMYDRNALETYWAIGLKKKLHASATETQRGVQMKKWQWVPCQMLFAWDHVGGWMLHLVVQNTVFFSELLTCIFRQPTFQCSRSIEDTAKVDVKPAVKSSQQSWCFRNPGFTNQLRLVDYPIIYKVLFIQTVGCEWDLSPTQLAVFSSLYTVYIYIAFVWGFCNPTYYQKIHW